MREPVAGDLVAGGRDALHERRRALGAPAENEERAPRPALREQVEDDLRVALSPVLARRPALARHDRGKGCYLEVVLDVDGERVDDRWHRATSGLGSLFCGPELYRPGAARASRAPQNGGLRHRSRPARSVSR